MTDPINMNSPYVNAYDINSVNATQVDRLSNIESTSKVTEKQDSVYTEQQFFSENSPLSQTIMNSNTGIAISQIAQGGLQIQQNLVAGMKDLTNYAINEASLDQREQVAQELQNSITQFEQVAENTTYNRETLLKTSGDNRDDVSVVTDNTIVEILKADTMSIADNLKSVLEDFTNNEETMGNMLDMLRQGEQQLASFSNDFQSVSNELETITKQTMENEVNTLNEKSTVINVDYAQESSDFNKTNILALSGYVMQVQPNAQQQKTIALLS